MSLRNFHLAFIFVAIVCADLFGIWSVLDYMSRGNLLILCLGLGSVLGGFGLIAYAVHFVKMTDRANIH